MRQFCDERAAQVLTQGAGSGTRNTEITEGVAYVMSWFSGRLRCFNGKHERSEKHIHRAGHDDRFVSKCRFCGTPMRRRAKRDWEVISRAEYRAARRPVSRDGVLAP
jgi:hypothetical protein